MLPSSNSKLMKAVDNSTLQQPFSPSHGSSIMYCKEIEDEHPGYLRQLFRYAQRILGAKASFVPLADTMKLKSQAPGEIRTSLSLHFLQLWRWFVSESGKEYSPIDRKVSCLL